MIDEKCIGGESSGNIIYMYSILNSSLHIYIINIKYINTFLLVGQQSISKKSVEQKILNLEHLAVRAVAQKWWQSFLLSCLWGRFPSLP